MIDRCVPRVLVHLNNVVGGNVGY